MGDVNSGSIPPNTDVSQADKNTTTFGQSTELSAFNETVGIPLDIIIIDDDIRDSTLTLNILEAKKIMNKPNVFSDAEKALDYLFRSHEQHYGLPDVLLLDYSMPKLSGLEVLAEIRENPYTHNIPVFLLTNSVDDGTIEAECEKYKAQGILHKPLNIDIFINKIKKIDGFGLMLAKLPSASAVPIY